MKQYVGEYSSKAQEYIGSRRSTSPETTKLVSPIKREVITESAKTEPLETNTAPAVESAAAIKTEDFPAAPQTAPVAQNLDSDIVASVEPAEQAGDREPLLAI